MTVKDRVGKRGRPPQTPQEAERVRARIVAATAEVFAERGSHGSNVALIIERAGIARPTFYRYFANADEPLHVLLDGTDDALVAGVRAAARDAAEGIELGTRVIDAYLTWARDLGPILRPVFGELYNRASPVSLHLERVLDQLRDVMVDKMTELDRPVPTPLDLDTLLHACVFVVYRLADHGMPGEAETTAARATMIRIALATLGMPDDLRRAMAVPGVFDRA